MRSWRNTENLKSRLRIALLQRFFYSLTNKAELEEGKETKIKRRIFLTLPFVSKPAKHIFLPVFPVTLNSSCQGSCQKRQNAASLSSLSYHHVKQLLNLVIFFFGVKRMANVIVSSALTFLLNRAFSHDVTTAMLVFQNKELAAMMVYQTNSTLFLCKYFLLFQQFSMGTGHVSENAPQERERKII